MKYLDGIPMLIRTLAQRYFLAMMCETSSPMDVRNLLNQEHRNEAHSRGDKNSDLQCDEDVEVEDDEEIEEDISVGSASPAHPPCSIDTDDSMGGDGMRGETETDLLLDEDLEVDEGSPQASDRLQEEDHDIDDDSSSGVSRTRNLETSPELNKKVPSPKVEPPDPDAPRTPPVAHQANHGALGRALKFSIDNILKPDFGRKMEDDMVGPDSLHDDQPVDLSRVTQGGFKKGTLPALAPLPPREREKERSSGDSTLWPAWVYCTRYSDRPSAGIV